MCSKRRCDTSGSRRTFPSFTSCVACRACDAKRRGKSRTDKRRRRSRVVFRRRLLWWWTRRRRWRRPREHAADARSRAPRGASNKSTQKGAARREDATRARANTDGRPRRRRTRDRERRCDLFACHRHRVANVVDDAYVFTPFARVKTRVRRVTIIFFLFVVRRRLGASRGRIARRARRRRCATFERGRLRPI